MKRVLLISIFAIICNCSLHAGERLENPPPVKDSQTAESPAVPQAEKPFKKPDTCNFKFIGIDVGIPDNTLDKKSYYRVFIDRAEAGRTTIDSDSKDKVFEAMLNPKKHVLTVEKFSLDEEKGMFIKLHNINQPKPDQTAFTIENDKILIIRLTQHASREAAFFTIEYERE